jgi:hypothetical protein
MTMPNLLPKKTNCKQWKPVCMKNLDRKRRASLADAVSIGTSCSAGWHSALRRHLTRPVLSVTYSLTIFGSRVAYSSGVV